jgi:hypothetical protein
MHRTSSRRFFRRSRHARHHADAFAEAPAAPPAAAPATADPQRVAVLRHKLCNASRLDRVMTYFLHTFGLDQDFMRLGTPMRNDRLKTMLGQVASHMVGGDAKNMQAWFLHLPEHRMVHGMILFGNWTGISFYFEDLEMGLCALSDASLAGPTYCVRFQLKELDERPARERAAPQGQNVMM